MLTFMDENRPPSLVSFHFRDFLCDEVVAAEDAVDVAAILNRINHADGVVRVADDVLALAVQREFFARKDVLACALDIGLEVAGWADVGPIDIRDLAERVERLAHHRRERQVLRREVRRAFDLHRVRLVEVERASAAKRIEDGIKAFEVFFREIHEQIKGVTPYEQDV